MRGEFQGPNGYKIAYEHLEGSIPGVMFFSGFKSDMTGQKAEACYAFCRERGIHFTRFDYGGHGTSGGVFDKGNIGAWLADALAVFDSLTQGSQILVGSSMGGWIALLLALKRKVRVAGLIGIAAAPDFTKKLIWNVMTDAQKAQLSRDGFFPIPNCYGSEPYNITMQLIEEGRKHLLLNAPIPITCPVTLLHGTHDEDVPIAIAHTLQKRLPQAKLVTIENGNHRLSEPEHLALLRDELQHMLNHVTPPL